MKKLITCLLLMLAATGHYAQQAGLPVVAVAPFDNLSKGKGVSDDDVRDITDVFESRLTNTDKVTVVNRSVIEKIKKEHNFQNTDWSSKEKTAKLGDALGADWIVSGNIRKSGEGMLIIVQFHDIKTLKLTSTDIRVADFDDAYGKMDDILEKLLANIDSGAKSTKKGKYEIGDTGTGGGIVFSIEGNTCYEAIQISGSYDYNKAVSIARNYRGGTCADWRLPTMDELTQIYLNLLKSNKASFGGCFWSSSEASNNTKLLQCSDGEEIRDSGISKVSVIVVRKFTP